MNRLLVALAVALLTAAPARADLPPPLPFTKYARPTHRVETREDARAHVFLIVWSSTRPFYTAPPPEFVTPDPAGVIAITTRDLPFEVAEFFVVARSATAPYGTAPLLAEAVKVGRVIPLARHTFEFREPVASWSGDPVLTYELRPSGADGYLVVVRTGVTPLFSWYVAAIFACLAMVVGGYQLARRLRRPRLAPGA